ncbi:MAG: VCBS repeat-containing protein [Myxococcales bacterium]|nr:VCBS repeat-containing protein [Myxococcales bacterium]
MKKVLAIFGLLALLAGSAAAAGFVSQSPAVDGRVFLVVPIDLNGDGRQDLLVPHATGEKPNAQPHLAVFLAQPAGYAASPDFDLTLPADACLFDAADLDGDGLQELVLLRKWQVQSLTPRAGTRPEWTTLIKHGTGVLFPSFDGYVPYEDFARDWNGDGQPEVAFPDYGVMPFYGRGEKGEWAKVGQVALHARGWLSVQNRETDNEIGDQLQGGFNLPKRMLVVGKRGRELYFTQGEEIWRHPLENGMFREKGERLYFPFLTEQERRNDNMNVVSTVEDLNGDGYPDLILQKLGGSLTNFKSALRIYAGNPAGFNTTPAYATDRDGLIVMLRYWDVTGDGNKEMFMPLIEVGLMQMARMLTTQMLKVKIQVYLGGPGFYGKDPQTTREITMKMNTDRGITFVGYPPNYGEDFDADGLPDLFMQHGNGFAIWKNQGKLSFSNAPIISAAVEPWGESRLRDLNGDCRADFYAWDTADPAKRGRILVLFNKP